MKLHCLTGAVLHRLPSVCLGQQGLDFPDQFFDVPNHPSAGRGQEQIGHFLNVLDERTEQHRPPERRRLQEIMPSHRDKTAAHKHDRPQTVQPS